MKKRIPFVKHQRSEKGGIPNLPIYGVYAASKEDEMRFQIFIGDKPVKDKNGVWQPTKDCLFTFTTTSYADCNAAYERPDTVRQLDIIDWESYENGILEMTMGFDKFVERLKLKIESLKSKHSNKLASFWNSLVSTFKEMNRNFWDIH